PALHLPLPARRSSVRWPRRQSPVTRCSRWPAPAPRWTPTPAAPCAPGAWGLEIPVAWQTEQPQTVVNLARAGLGVGVLNSLAARISDTDGMAVVPVGTLAEGRRVAVTRDRRTIASPSVDLVFDA